MSGARSWMLYGAAGHTGALIARHAQQRGHRPLLAGRNGPAIAALAGDLNLPYLALALDDPAALNAALGPRRSAWASRPDRGRAFRRARQPR